MKLTYLLIIALCFTFVSCKKEQTISVEHGLGEFDTLVFSDVFDVTLIQGTENKIKVMGSSKFVAHVDWETTNNTLKIRNNSKKKWLNPTTNKIHLEVTVNGIARIIANETCAIKSQNELIGNELGLILKSKLNHASLQLNCNTFYYWNNFPCGGTITLKGQCHTIKLWNYALMQINATQLQTSIGEIENTSKGDIHLWCSDSITYKINGTGNIYVRGNPLFLQNNGGTGSGILLFE